MICWLRFLNSSRHWRCSIKKMFLKIWQNLQISGNQKKRLWHRYFQVRFEKFLRNPVYKRLPGNWFCLLRCLALLIMVLCIFAGKIFLHYILDLLFNTDMLIKNICCNIHELITLAHTDSSSLNWFLSKCSIFVNR